MKTNNFLLGNVEVHGALGDDLVHILHGHEGVAHGHELQKVLHDSDGHVHVEGDVLLSPAHLYRGTTF